MHFNNIFYQETNGQCSVTSISNKNDTTHIAPSTCTYGEHFETLQHPIFSLGADDMISVEANQTSDSKYLPDNSMFKKFFVTSNYLYSYVNTFWTRVKQTEMRVANKTV